MARENRGSFLPGYIARERITVHAHGATIIREGHGSGEGRGTSLGEVHDIALKAAETDATKRALATFGKPFGLEVYRSTVFLFAKPGSCRAGDFKSADTATRRFSSGRYDADPEAVALLWPAAPSSTSVLLRSDLAKTEQNAADSLILSARTIRLHAGQIDKSQRAIAEPNVCARKAHLKFVASQPCLICGRHLSDPHHLGFAQPRAIGLKVSDQFTVPLCRGHHRQLHQPAMRSPGGKSTVNALETARDLWEQTHPLAIQHP